MKWLCRFGFHRVREWRVMLAGFYRWGRCCDCSKKVSLYL